MKKCSRCSKIATLHITEINDGKVDELHLCESCAKMYLNQPPSNLDEEFPAVEVEFNELMEEEEAEESLAEEVRCPSCGITYKEFRSKGRLGCPQDYIIFQSQLMGLLDNIHNSTQHTGKYPKRAPKASQKQFELIKLRNDLNEAVQAENYEDAARLRDQINELEQETSIES
ncbi:UvrB/uvrC motif protein [Polystyrenella longa]|uniref:UvrB/uvrC motif protein n=1 Tax=Polystyrenella longa TaxID=2528007 RepID=A0A518CU03_9PLAN|nr:UvrB/UvrC motif-containing protein [Polystyrenella longa]QDU82720.1 UvrB/uvrC motif protein [Polystyrenella longa]